MRLVGTLIVLSVGIMIGQYSYYRVYNPYTLEASALSFAMESHYIGCKGAGGTDEFCLYTSDDYIKTVETIWHNKAWKKYNEQN